MKSKECFGISKQAISEFVSRCSGLDKVDCFLSVMSLEEVPV